jgi:hypothetical protein
MSASHTCPTAVKTDAPIDVLWDIMRHWAKLHPPSRVPANSPAERLLAKEPSHAADFAVRQDVRNANADRSTPRFVPNPTADWGPMQRAKGAGKGVAGGAEEKREKGKRVLNQGKKTERKRARLAAEAAAAEAGKEEGDEGAGQEGGEQEGDKSMEGCSPEKQ